MNIPKSIKNSLKTSIKRQEEISETSDKTTENDEALFAEAMQGVKPLKKTAHQSVYNQRQATLKAKQKLKKLGHQKRENAVHDFEELDIHLLDTTNPIGAFDSMSYYENGLRPQDLKKLKNSQFRLEAALDLHGKTYEEADFAIENFIQQALSCNMKYVRIIHGKGYNSNAKQPVLKNLCLQKLKCFHSVVAFCSAPEKDGGVGAVNIQLRA